MTFVGRFHDATPGPGWIEAHNKKGRFGPSLILQMQREGVESKRPGRHSSVVEQLIRNQQVWGSNPHAGSILIDF